MASVIDIVFVYEFIKALVVPFKETKAFELGIIDERGTILKKHKDLKTAEEKKAYTYRNRLVWNLKKVLEKVPIMRNKLASYAAALFLLKEDIAKYKTTEVNLFEDAFADKYDFVIEDVQDKPVLLRGAYKLDSFVGFNYNEGDDILVLNDTECIGESFGFNMYKVLHLESEDDIVVPLEVLVEDGIANAVGTGSGIAGITGDPPRPKRKKKIKPLRRSKFAGVDVFEVDTDTYHNTTQGKKKFARWSKYINTSEDSPEKEIYDYARKHPKKGIIVQNCQCGSMQYLRRKAQ